ncbi:MAG TPA: mannose-6-phosphate isomerase [Hellea balneolensis]|uniref:Mannose-6-phosphate isomerase n=1 Tax=Hellea balneolensis TaxID=287478 RepID=A0A7V5U152_9PROT|nr:mannose-6-phosphate isomerase [Hellea balneolensis]
MVGIFTQTQKHMSDAADLTRIAGRAHDWLVHAALPFWADQARDGEGGFCEELHADGQPNWQAVRRLRVQARQIYSYAMAYRMGWCADRSVADHTLDFMLAKGFMPDERPGFIALLNPDGSVKDDRRDLYDHAFYLMALARHSQICTGHTTLALADSLIAFLDDELAAENGGWTEGLPRDDPRNALRRQNPHMHLFEAFLTLYDASGNAKYLRRAHEIYELFQAYFFDEETATITEFFHQNWRPARGAKGQSVEPGHMAEWVWLLGQYEQRTGNSTRKPAERLYQKLLSYDGPFLFDEMDKTGRVLRRTSRLWVQTEMVKAHLAQAEFGHRKAPAIAAYWLERILDDYLRPEGCWTDVMGENGLPLHGPVPTSTFYHIVCMITEAVRVSHSLDKPKKRA